MKNQKFDTKRLDNSKYSDDFDDDDAKTKSMSELDRLLAEEDNRPQRALSVGTKVRCELVAIGGEEVFFAIQISSSRPRDGVVPRKALLNDKGELPYKVGDKLDLYVTRTKGSLIELSPSALAKSHAENMMEALKMALPMEGKVSEVCNGGVRVSIQGKTAFCPIGQLDLARVESAESYVGQKFNFLITEIKEGGRNIVVSRRKLLQGERELSEKVFLKEKKEGDIVEGKVKRLEAYGAFVEIAPSIEGLVHISEISWSRIGNAGDALALGQKVRARILKNEKIDGRLKVSLSIKQAETEPWADIANRFQEGQIAEGRVVRCLKFGAFVELVAGIEGLVPLSEMSHTKRVVRSDELFKEGDRVVVMIKEIHPETKKILLSLKDAGSDPWALVHQKFPVGSVVRGKVNRREAYGIFVELEEGITGLLPKASALENTEFHYDKIKLSDTVTVQVAEVNLEDRRISLAPPQDPDKDAWRDHMATSVPSKDIRKGTMADKLKNFSVKKS